MAADVVQAIFEALETGREPELATLLHEWPDDEHIVREEWSAIFGSRQAAADPDPSLQFGRFRVRRLLGRGGQGVVYLALDELLGRVVALKLVSKSGPGAVDAFSRAKREASVLARLRHRAICEIFDFVDCGDSHGIVLRFVEGMSLADFCAAPVTTLGAIDLERRRNILIDVADGLMAAHEVGVIHRDIKPGNVMVGKDGRAVILDFGLARLLSSDATLITRTGEACGTPKFMAPEQWTRPRELDVRVDVFALGVLTAALLSHGPNAVDVVIDWENARTSLESGESRVALDSAIARIVKRATEFHPEDRYPDIASMRRDLVQWKSGGRVGRVRWPSVAGVWRRLRRRPLVLRLVLALTLAIAAGAWGLVEFSAVQAHVSESGNRAQYQSALRSTLELLSAGDIGAARAKLDECAKRERGLEHRLLMRRLDSGAPRLWLGAIDAPAELTPDDGGWVLRESTGRTLRITSGEQSVVAESVADSSDHRLLLASGFPVAHEQGAIWHSSSGPVAATWSSHPSDRRTDLHWTLAGDPGSEVAISVRGYVTAATGSRDGLRLYVGVRSGGAIGTNELFLLDSVTGEELSRCAIPGRATALAVDAEESWLMIGFASGSVWTMDAWLRQCLFVDDLHTEPIVALSKHPQLGRRLSLDRAGICVSTAGAEPVTLAGLVPHEFVGFGEHAVIRGPGRLLYNAPRPGAPVAEYAPFAGSLAEYIGMHPSDRVVALAHASEAEKTFLATGSRDAAIVTVDRDGSRESFLAGGGHGRIRKLAASDDGRRLAILHQQGELRILDVEESRSDLVTSRAIDIDRMSWSPDGSCLGFASRSGRVGIHDCGTNDQRTLTLDREIVDFAISRREQRLFVADVFGTVQIRHLIDGQPLLDISARATPILGVALVDDGSRLCVVRSDGAVELHEIDPLRHAASLSNLEVTDVRGSGSVLTRSSFGPSEDPLELCAQRVAFEWTADVNFALGSGPFSVLIDPACGHRWYELAERVIRRRIPVEPSSITAAGLGAAALRTGHAELAIEHLQRASEDERALHGRVQPMTLAFLVMARQATGDLESAARGLEQLREMLGDRFGADPLATEVAAVVEDGHLLARDGHAVARVPSPRLRRTLGWVAVSSPRLDRSYTQDVLEWYRSADDADLSRVDVLLKRALFAALGGDSTTTPEGDDSVEYSSASEIECALASLVFWSSNDRSAARLAFNRFSVAARRAGWTPVAQLREFEDWLRTRITAD